MKYTALLFFACTSASLLTVCSVAMHVHERVPTDQAVYVRKFSIPGYSPVARQGLIQGEVSATVHIQPNGTVDTVSDVKGHPLLSHPVSEALKSWEFFVPNNQATELRITFHFSLEGNEARECIVYRISGRLPNLIKIITNPTSEKLGPDVESRQGRRPESKHRL